MVPNTDPHLLAMTAAIYADGPDAAYARQVLPDYLEEHDDPRAELMRMVPTLMESPRITTWDDWRSRLATGSYLKPRTRPPSQSTRIAGLLKVAILWGARPVKNHRPECVNDNRRRILWFELHWAGLPVSGQSPPYVSMGTSWYNPARVLFGYFGCRRFNSWLNVAEWYAQGSLDQYGTHRRIIDIWRHLWDSPRFWRAAERYANHLREEHHVRNERRIAEGT